MSDYLVPTGWVIKDYLEQRGISQKELAKRICISERHLSHLLTGKSRLTEDVALKLEKVMPDVNAGYWLNYEASYQEYIAREKEKSDLASIDLTAISKRFHFKDVLGKTELPLVDQAIEILKFLGISSFDQLEAISPKYAIEFMQDGGEREAIVIWLKFCETAVEEQNPWEPLNEYSESVLRDNLGLLKDIATNNEASSLLSCRKLLNKCGVTLTIRSAITNSKVRGALTTYGGHPAIYVSGRFKTHDHIWFTIIHELAHLLQGYDSSLLYVSMEELKSEEPSDCKANEFARDFFVNQSSYYDFINNANFSERSVRGFAAKQGIDPGIVVGFLEHDGYLEYGKLGYLKTPISIEQEA